MQQECYKNSIPVLPIHDSYISSTEHAHKLLGIITSVYEQLTGFKPEVSMDVNSEAEKLTQELLAKYTELVSKTINV